MTYPGFYVRDEADSGPSDPDLTTLFSSDLKTLAAGHDRISVVSGCVVTGGTGRTVDIASGTVTIRGRTVAITSKTGVAIAANASGNPRYDLVEVTASNTANIVQGTAAADPTPPDPTDGNVVLARVWVPDGETDTTNADITDLRIINSLQLPADLRIQHVWLPSKGAADTNDGRSFASPVATVAQAKTNLTLGGVMAGLIVVGPGKYQEQIILPSRVGLVGAWGHLGGSATQSVDPEKQVSFEMPDGQTWDYIIGLGAGVDPGGDEWWHWGVLKNIWVDGRGDANGVSEVQTVDVSGASSGTFTLTFEGYTTAPIAFDASAATVETELEKLVNIENVTCTGGPLNTAPVSVEFTDRKANCDQMTNTNSTDGTVTNATTSNGTGPTAKYGIWSHQLGENSIIENVYVRHCTRANFRFSGVPAGGVIENVGSWSPRAGGIGIECRVHPSATGNSGSLHFGKVSGDSNIRTKGRFLRVTGDYRVSFTAIKLEGWDVVCEMDGIPSGGTNQFAVVQIGQLDWNGGTGIGINKTVHRRSATCQGTFILAGGNFTATNLIDDRARDPDALLPINDNLRTGSIVYGHREFYLGGGGNWTGRSVFLGPDAVQLWMRRLFHTTENTWKWYDMRSDNEMRFIQRYSEGFGFFYDDQAGTTQLLAQISRESNAGQVWTQGRLALGGANEDAANVFVLQGSGSPEGVSTANPGSLFMRTD